MKNYFKPKCPYPNCKSRGIRCKTCIYNESEEDHYRPRPFKPITPYGEPPSWLHPPWTITCCRG